MLEKEIAEIKLADLTEQDKTRRIRMIDENRKYFERVLNENQHKKAIAKGETKLSYKATMSALLINLYRDQPILHLPYQFLRSLVELDYKIFFWRFRHMQMVEKMLGKKLELARKRRSRIFKADSRQTCSSRISKYFYTYDI